MHFGNSGQFWVGRLMISFSIHYILDLVRILRHDRIAPFLWGKTQILSWKQKYAFYYRNQKGEGVYWGEKYNRNPICLFSFFSPYVLYCVW